LRIDLADHWPMFRGSDQAIVEQRGAEVDAVTLTEPLEYVCRQLLPTRVLRPVRDSLPEVAFVFSP
jgi:hypothetical protein